MILAFDQAPTRIGWCYGLPGAIPQRGVHNVPGYGDNTCRLRKYVREWCVNFIKSSGATRVFFEQILVRKTGLSMPILHRQFAVVGGIETACELLGLEDECYEVMIADWRRDFYAGSRPTKGQDSESEAWKAMALTECARRGWLCTDHNAAEACAIWDYGCRFSDKVYRARSDIGRRRKQMAIDEARRENA